MPAESVPTANPVRPGRQAGCVSLKMRLAKDSLKKTFNTPSKQEKLTYPSW